jgi:hypothetical protein
MRRADGRRVWWAVVVGLGLLLGAGEASAQACKAPRVAVTTTLGSGTSS